MISHFFPLQVEPTKQLPQARSHIRKGPPSSHRSTTIHELWWLIFGDLNPQWTPGLKLSAAGSKGLPELQQCISQSEQSVFFVFCRIFVDGVNCFATITYLPEGTSGLRRGAPISAIQYHPYVMFDRSIARTSMASRTVQSWFKVRPLPMATRSWQHYLTSVLRVDKPL